MDESEPRDQSEYVKWFLSLVTQNKLSSFLIFLGVTAFLFGIFGILRNDLYKYEGIEILTDESINNTSVNPSKIIVEVVGEVETPGVFELNSGDRIYDALLKAGGLTENADTEYVDRTINKASKLDDGQKIYIPAVNNQSDVLSANNSNPVKSVENTLSSLVNINSDSIEKLDSLPGIGQTYAQRIIDQRPYSSLDELKNKKVIPESVFEKIKDQITLY